MIKLFPMNAFGSLFQSKETSLDQRHATFFGQEIQLLGKFLHIMILTCKYKQRIKYKMVVLKAKDQSTSFVHFLKKKMRKIIIKNFCFREGIALFQVMQIQTKLLDFLMRTFAKLNLRKLRCFQKIVLLSLESLSKQYQMFHMYFLHNKHL